MASESVIELRVDELHEHISDVYNDTTRWSVEDSIAIAEGLIACIRTDIAAMRIDIDDDE